MRPRTLLLVVLLVAPPAGAFHTAPMAEDEVARVDRAPGVTWRSVAFNPSGDHALVVGGYEEGNESYSLIAEWTPGEGLSEVYNRSGPPLVDVDFRKDGTSLVVGLRDTILFGEPGSYRNLWDESEYASSDQDLTFYGLGVAFAPDGSFAIASGSSLLRVEQDGSLEVIHGGKDAFFRSIDFNPTSDYALVEAAVQQERETILGTVWRTNGFNNLTSEDNVAIYGRHSRGSALLNAISFAPNGTFATFAGRDGSGASFMTWSPDRDRCHRHEADESRCHDHTYRYIGAGKPTGPVTCIDWHESGRYALVTGLEEDVVGYANDRLWAPLMHQGPDLHGCALGPNGTTGVAVGANGTVLRVQPGSGPLVRVLDPKPGRLVPPNADQRFLVGTIDRSPGRTTDVTTAIDPDGTPEQAAPMGEWWTQTVNASGLSEGEHKLVVTATGDEGNASVAFPFIVNNEAFSPSTPAIQRPTGLEGQGLDSDGLFTLHWENLDEPVVYEIEQTRRGSRTNTTDLIQAGSSANQTVRVTQDGTYLYRVRALNTYEASNWSREVSIEVVLDSDGDGVPNKRDPQPHTENQWGDADNDGIATDVELNQCSDPQDPNSTPTSDDDGDGIPNGIECRQGTDPRDPNDPPPDDEDQTNESPNDTTNETPPEPDRDTPAPAVGIVVGLLVLVSLIRRRGSGRS